MYGAVIYKMIILFDNKIENLVDNLPLPAQIFKAVIMLHKDFSPHPGHAGRGFCIVTDGVAIANLRYETFGTSGPQETMRKSINRKTKGV